MIKLKNKKTAVDLTDLALGIVILGIAVSIGAAVLVNMRNAQATNAATYSVNGEVVTPTDAGANLAVTWGKSVDYCQNSTGGPVISSGNYSYSVNDGNGIVTLKNLTSSFAHASWKCNYTVYNVSDPRYTVPDKASLGLAEYGSWFKIIVIVGVAAVVLGIIFMAFGNKSSQSSGVSY